MVDKVEEYRAMLIETAVEQDDDAMEAYLEGNEPDLDTLKKCIRKGTINLDFFPTYCGSSFKNKGVQNVLDGVVDYLPCPTEVNPQPEVNAEGEETGEFAVVEVEKPLRALAFKIMDDKYGALTFTRIYSGKISKGTNVLNTFTGKTERIGRIIEMHADERNEVDSAQAGDIVALLGMKSVQTGHTLCDPAHPATLEPMVFPEPVISIAIKPKDQGNAEKMGIAIGKMVAEDPTFVVETDEDSGETILKGMGELHLDIKVDILKRTYGVEALIGKPQVAYRESITKTLKTATPIKNNLVVRVSLRRSNTHLNHSSQAKAFNLSPQLSVVTFLVNSGQQSKKASIYLKKKVSSRAILAWTSKSHSQMVPSTQWTPRQSLSRPQLRQHIVSHSPKRVLRSLSPS